jgi:hypothetical protein
MFIIYIYISAILRAVPNDDKQLLRPNKMQKPAKNEEQLWGGNDSTPILTTSKDIVP